ncbi:GGDEF domain-containing protein [Oscillospiraceae bacterium MB08-C2-2]|nr:GGDEF domain-containing protein [Oscillospiraceae bacterium MB08-C2-2]
MKKLIRIVLGDRSCFASKKEMAECATVSIFAVAFLIVHLAFIPFFFISSIWQLGIVNAFSMLIYAVVVLINVRVKGVLSSLLIVLELCAYSVASVYIVGWEANTQWFLPFMIIPCYLSFPISRRRAWVYIALLCAALFYCYWVYLFTPPLYHINLQYIILLNLFFCTVCAIVVIRSTHFAHHLSETSYRERIQKLASDAAIDPLTKLGNRRYAESKLQGLINAQNRSTTCFAMMDIDYFKKINDTYGHSCGDEVLKILAEQISLRFRKSDIVVRWGGEEFLLILTNTGGDAAQRVLSNFRRIVEQMPFVVDGRILRVTITIGYYECSGHIGVSQAIDFCDQALYYGKNHGRNCIVRFHETGMRIN